MHLKFLAIKIFTALQDLPFLHALSRNMLILSLVFFSARNLLHRSYFILARDANVEFYLKYSYWIGCFLMRRLERSGFNAVTFIALCHILPSRFLLGVFQKHLTSIASEPDCLAIMMHKGLGRVTLHDSRDAPFSQIETYQWTLDTAMTLAKQGDTPDILNFVSWFGGSPPLASARASRQMAETYRKLERMADKLDIPIFSEPAGKTNGRLRVGLFRFDYTPQSEGGTGEVDLLKSLLVNLPPDISFCYLGMAPAPNQTVGNHPYVKLSEDVKTAIMEARALALDVVVYTPPIWGSFLNKMNRLIAHRIAKTQIYFAGDVMTSGMPTLDYWVFSSPDNKSLPRYQQGFTEKLLNVSFTLPLPPFFTAQDQSSIDAPNGLISYVTNCHIFKMNDELLRTWAEILQQVPNSQIILCPYGNELQRSYAPILMQLIHTACIEKGINPNRFVIHDIAGAPALSKMLATGQIYLDSFPYTGSFSTAEALNIGLPSVCLASDEAYHARLCRDVAGFIGMETEIIVSNIESYVQRAVELGKQPELRSKMAALIRKQRAKLSLDQQNRSYSNDFWRKLRGTAQSSSN